MLKGSVVIHILDIASPPLYTCKNGQKLIRMTSANEIDKRIPIGRFQFDFVQDVDRDLVQNLLLFVRLLLVFLPERDREFEGLWKLLRSDDPLTVIVNHKRLVCSKTSSSSNIRLLIGALILVGSSPDRGFRLPLPPLPPLSAVLGVTSVIVTE